MQIDFPRFSVSLPDLDQIRIPRMVKIRQKYNKDKIEDITGHIHGKMEAAVPDKGTFSGKRIAITAGSRGIPHYPMIMRAMVDKLKQWGAQPFIVPAMGSHAGATAEGQQEMLTGFGITEQAIGCPVYSSMDVVAIGQLEDGTVLYCDKLAYESDGILVFNKVKVHTCFKAEHESGLLKMMVIGLGKHVGASSMHMQGYSKFPALLREGGALFLQKAPVVLGVGLVQNAMDDISDIEVYLPNQMVEGDAHLLAVSKDKMARLYMDETDVVIIDRIGKNISGSGFDPNVIQRKDRKFPGALRNQVTLVRGLTPESHHNAVGIGHIDLTTQRCMQDVDWGITWTNIMTATDVYNCRMPCFAPDDRTAILWAIRSCTKDSRENVRIVRIQDTVNMEYIEVSENLAAQLAGREDIEILSEPFEIPFGDDGYIVE